MFLQKLYPLDCHNMSDRNSVFFFLHLPLGILVLIQPKITNDPVKHLIFTK